MKVTVCFGNVRVIVPCGDGGLLVKDLTVKAIARYRKATGKPNDTCVTVHSLKSLNDGGILDCDDCVNAVADDREQIIAIFDEQTSPLPHNNAGDGSSGNSEGTESPELFRGRSHDFLSKPEINYSTTDVEIPDKGLPLGVTPLQVRRGSEPALNRLSPEICSPTINKNGPLPINSLPYSVDPKRWSSAVAGMFTEEDKNNNNNKVPPNTAPPIGNYSDQKGSKDMLLPPPGDRGEGSGREEGKSAFSRFSRNSVRLSMLGSEALSRWAEAADRQVMKMQTTDGRREPLGGSATSPDARSSDSVFSFPPENHYYEAILKKEDGPLGIHVVPNSDQFGRGDGCLVIQGIESDGRIAKDGRFQIGDKIEEINGVSLLSVNFRMAQDIFKNALLAEELKLRLRKAAKSKIPPPVLPKPQMCQNMKPRHSDSYQENEDKGFNAKVATVSPTKKQSTLSTTDTMLAANTRKIGKRIHIQLVKGSEGLGFSITTRDNPAAGNCPIYIKSILPKGAAVRDGRLKIRDRLLMVNNQEMTGLEQKEAVAILRNTPLGGAVDLVVSRQDVVEGEPEEPPPSQPNLPRQLPTKNEDPSTFPWKDRKVFTFDIPLSDTGSAGLGISIKGKTSTGPNGSVDLGIFVKSVIHGGAASKDGRLKPNDQLVNINGSSLLSVTNADAMETLRYAMFNNQGPHPGAITLTVARNILDPDADTSHNTTSNSDNLISFESPNTSEDAENTVVFQPNDGGQNCSFESSRIEDKDLGLDTVFPNPVVDRLKGNTSNSMRSESYLRGSDNWNNQPLQQCIYGSMRRHDDSSCLVAPTINLPSTDTVMIEDPYGTTLPKLMRNQMDPRTSNLPSTEKHFPSRDEVCPDGGPASPKQKPPDIQDFTFVSELSLNEDSDAFARDGFGRQSMSEKRHAQLDARNTDTFQRNKMIREERERQRAAETEMLKTMENPDSLEDRMKINALRSHSVKVPNANGVSVLTPNKEYGPSLGLKKSSSLESLHTLVHETQRQEEEAEDIYSRTGSRGGRGRGCNESFRAAVDRSYDGPGQLPEGHSMETLDEESESGSHYGAYNAHQYRQHTKTAPGLPVSSQKAPPMKAAHDDMLNPYSGKRPTYDKSGHKKKGLFKGLGHMFKFGKQKRNEDMQKQSQQEIDRQREQERIQARRAAQDEQERIQEQYKILLERQRKMEQQNQQHIMVTSSQPPNANLIMTDQNSGSQSRQERIYELRAQHQRRHQERRGQYPQDEQEEQYERQIQEQVDRQKSRQHLYIKHYQRQIANQYTGKIYAQLPHKTPQHRRTQSQRYYQGSKQYQPDQPINHSRSNSYDPLKEMERPGSRKGFADPSPGRGKAITDQYNHYMNYEEIQYHMRQFQQHPDHVPRHQNNQLPRSNVAGHHGESLAGNNVGDYDRLPNHRQQRPPLQVIETNSVSHHNNQTPPYHRPPAPMPPGGLSVSIHQRTPRHLPPEIPHSAKRGDSQSIYGHTPIKSLNQSIYSPSPRQPSTPSSFQNTRSPSSYQNSPYDSSSNSRGSSTPGSKV